MIRELVLSLAAWTILISSAAAFQAAGTTPLPVDSVISPSALTKALERQSDWSFDRYSKKAGLANNITYAITQDSVGFMWVGTFNGLSRFDGHRFRNYHHDDDDPMSLPGDQVRALLAGVEGSVWVGTNGHGLVIFDAKVNGFRRISEEPQDLSHRRIYSLADDHQGGVWICYQEALGHYQPDKHLFEVNQFGDGTGFSQRQVFSALADSKGNLWVGGDQGLIVRRKGAQNFEAVQLKSINQTTLPTPVWSIFQDSAGNIWVGTDGYGLGLASVESMSVQTIAELSGPGSRIGASTVRGILEPKSGELWITTYGNGILIYNIANREITEVRHKPTASSSISSNFLRGAVVDRSGLVWVTSEDGVSVANSQARGLRVFRPASFAGSDLTSVLAAKDGRIWMGFSTGDVGVINLDGSVTKAHWDNSSASSQNPHRELLSMAEGTDGSIYGGSYGLQIIDPVTLVARPFGPPNLRREVVGALFVDGANIWLGTYSGAYRLDIKTQVLNRYSRDGATGFSLSDNAIQYFQPMPDGRLMIGARSGLNILDPLTGQVVIPKLSGPDQGDLSNANVFVLIPDQSSRYWMGTGLGSISILDIREMNQSTIQTIGAAENLRAETSAMMAQGADGRVWVKGSEILSAIHPDTFAVDNYGKADGMPTETRSRHGRGQLLADGTLLFPISDGLMVVRPDGFSAQSTKAALVLTAIGNANGNGDGNLQITGLASRPDRIALVESNRDLFVEYALLDFSDPSAVQYFHKLDGFDRDWLPSDAEHANAAYTNLPHGEYRLFIRATVSSGAGYSAELSVPVVVYPHVWEMLWFKTLLGLGGVLLAFSAAKAYAEFQARRRRRLEQLVAERTKEYIIARDEAEHLSRVKDILLANVSHELRTPLNAIANYSQLIFEDAVEANNSSLIEDIKKVRIATEHLMKLINDVLEVSKVEAGKATVIHEKIDIDTFMADIGALGADFAAKGENVFEVNILATDKSLTSDPTRLRQILLNLMSNGSKFTHRGRIVLTVDGDEQSLQFCVEDTGIGMTPEQLSRVFQPFEQGESGTYRQYGGTGLGLTLASNLVELLHGTIHAESELGKGSRFIVQLPRTPPAHS